MAARRPVSAGVAGRADRRPHERSRPKTGFLRSLLLLPYCWSIHGGAQPAAVSETPSPSRLVCMGRYSFALPAEGRPIGRTQWMNHARIDARAATPADTLDGIAAAIEKREREGDPYLPVTGATQERIAPDTIVVTVRKHPDHARVSAARLAGGSAFEAVHELGEEKWPLARQTVLAIVRAIAPDAGPARHSTGFCIDRGIVDLPFEWQEAVAAGFEFGSGRRLFVDIQTNGKNVPAPLLRDASAIQRRMRATGLRTQTLRARARTLGGIDGEELVIVSEERQDALLQWLAVGKPISGEHPSIRMRVEGRYAERGKLLAGWDALLDSLRRR